MREKSFNFFYLFVLFLAIGIVYLIGVSRKGADQFFGFAENQEQQINLDHSVIIRRIFCAPGQQVNQGDTLLIVDRGDLQFKYSQLEHDVRELGDKEALRKMSVQGELDKLKAQRFAKEEDIRQQIRNLESRIQLNQQILKNLKSIPGAMDTAKNSPLQIELNGLYEELHIALTPYDEEIKKLESSLRNGSGPAVTQIAKLHQEKMLWDTIKNGLVLRAPAQGIIGNIRCKEGEYISAYNTMISFYDVNPNSVIGYIHENLSTQVKKGNKVQVISALHPEVHCEGIVNGLGYRIIEIPERLRKIPEVITFGREVIIQIPSENHFLQKEKVILNIAM